MSMKLRFHGKLGFKANNSITAYVVVLSLQWQPPDASVALKRVYYCLYKNGFIRTLTRANAYIGTTRLVHLDLEDAMLDVVQLRSLAFLTNADTMDDPQLPTMPAFTGFTHNKIEKKRPVLPRSIKDCVMMAPGIFGMQRHRGVVFDADFAPFYGLAIDLSYENLNEVKFGKADFRGASIVGTTFAGADVSRSQFDKTALKGLDLSGAKFAGGDFSEFDFSDANLSGADLTSANFSETKWNNKTASVQGLEGANLEKATFTNTEMTNVVLRTANACNANFKFAKMTNCDAAGATWTGANFGSAELNGLAFTDGKGGDLVFEKAQLKQLVLKKFSAEKVNFRGATLTDCDATEAILSHADFRGSTLTRVTFTGATLNYAVFSPDNSLESAKLEKIDLSEANLEAADFSKVILENDAVLVGKCPKFGKTVETATKFQHTKVPQKFLGRDWSYLDIKDGQILFDNDFNGDNINAKHAILGRHTSFSEKSFENADFSYATLSECVFSGCNFSEAKFESAVLAKAIFIGANLTNVEFINTDLNGTVFTQAVLQQTKFQKATLVQTTFESANLFSADFKAPSGGTIQGVNFNRSCLVNADFSDVIFHPYSASKTSFIGACLLGAKFQGTKLHGVNLQRAQLSKNGGSLNLIKRSGVKISKTYSGQELPEGATGSETICPFDGYGPCTDAQLYIKDTEKVPKEWRESLGKDDTAKT